MKKALRKITIKFSSSKGFSLGELLAATLILLLASQVMAQGVAFAARMYNESLTRSHSKQLCSSLTAAIETELRYTTSIEYDTSTGKLKNYFSREYGQTGSSFLSIDQDNKVADTGELAVKTNSGTKSAYQRLLSSSTYSSYDLQAKVVSTTYDKDENQFTVNLEIYNNKDEKLLESTFDVIPINNLKINEEQ